MLVAIFEIKYARVSAKNQNPERQLINRPQYQGILLIIREGDLLFLNSLDRLGIDYDGIIRVWKYITRDLNAEIVVLEKETLFDSRKSRGMGDTEKLLEDQF